MHLPEKSLRKIVPHMDLFVAGRYAGSRDVHLALARAQRIRFPEETVLVRLIRTEYMHRARQDHRQYWKALRRVRMGQVVPLRIPVLQGVHA